LKLVSSRGGLATISILLHELPHELGDFATLVRAGLSKKRAILLQFTTAIAALIGTVFGVYAVEGFAGERLLYITAGGFVYLAAVTILPEVLDDEASMCLRLAQLFSFLTGIAFLYAVAAIEHQAEHSGGGHHHHHHSHSHHEHHHPVDERRHSDHEHTHAHNEEF
jgi:zinc transporter ZupT